MPSDAHNWALFAVVVTLANRWFLFFACEQNLYELLGTFFYSPQILDDVCGGHLMRGYSGIPRPHFHLSLIDLLLNCRQ